MAAHDLTGRRHAFDNPGRSVSVETVSGTWFDSRTSEDVRRVICAHMGEPVRLFLGDTATGAAWPEQYDVAGTLARSMGPVKAPLIVAPRASGGPAILDHCIVAVRTAAGWAYRHPSFNVGAWATGPADLPGYACNVLHNGRTWARCKSERAGLRLRAFMTGERLNP